MKVTRLTELLRELSKGRLSMNPDKDTYVSLVYDT